MECKIVGFAAKPLTFIAILSLLATKCPHLFYQIILLVVQHELLTATKSFCITCSNQTNISKLNR